MSGRLLSAFAVACLVGLSAWTAFSPKNLLESTTITAPLADSAEETVGNTASSDHANRDNAAGTVKRNSAYSGAKVEPTLTEDGSIVTKFMPRSRDGKGPVVIEVNRTIGQDPRMAASPNEDLLEDTSFGRLPIVGADGLRPVDQYARPWSGARGTRVAIVVGGLGLSQTGTQRAIRDLPEEITLAFAASGNSLQRWMQDARRNGHEILLQVPFEPFDYPNNDPGPHTLRVSLGEEKNLAELHNALGRLTNYTGVMNFMGGRFLADATALEPVMRDLANRGLLFLDDGTSAQSLTGTLAATFEMPHGFADVVLDEQLDRNAILKKLDDLERIARRNGSAIGVASAFDESVDAIRKWSEEAATRGMEIVGVSALANDPQRP